MSLFTEAELAEDRADFLTLCSDTVQITRTAVVGDAEYVDDTEIDEDTLQYPDQGRVVIYQGPGRLQVKVDINSNVVVSVDSVRKQIYVTEQLQLPVEAPTSDTRYVEGDPAAVDVDHVCEVLDAPHQPGLVGVTVGIAGPYHKSQATYLRFRVKEPVG